MTGYRSSFLKLLNERGYIHQMTDADGLDALAEKEIVTGYIGFDATAPSLHVGSLVQIMMLRRIQQTRNKPIVLMGGGAIKIVAPSGKEGSWSSTVTRAGPESAAAAERPAIPPPMTRMSGALTRPSAARLRPCRPA